jgi:hypothetical protein
MPIRLFDAHHDIVATTMVMPRFADRQIDGFALVLAMADDPAILIDNVPSVLGLIVVDMIGVLRTALFGLFGHISDR